MEEEKAPFWRTKLVETAILLDGALLLLVVTTGWLLGWQGWRLHGTALIWAGIAAVVSGVISALFAPGPEGRRRPRIPPPGDSIMWLLLLSGVVAIVVGMALRRF